MKRVKLVLFDLDGTLTTHKTGAWEAISEYAGECTHTSTSTQTLWQRRNDCFFSPLFLEQTGCLDEFVGLKKQYTEGVLDADTFMDRALGLWKGLPKAEAEAAAERALDLLPGVAELGAALRRCGVAVGLVTGSVEAPTAAAARVLGAADELVVCNKLEADGAGRLTGRADLWDTKDACARMLAARAGVALADTCFVGDSGTDVPAFGVCGHSLAVNAADARVAAAATHTMRGVTDARALLAVLLPRARVVWVRHGHGAHNALADRLGLAAYDEPMRDPGLTPRGRRQALAARRALQARGLWPPDAVYCSPLGRCVETARFICADEASVPAGADSAVSAEAEAAVAECTAEGLALAVEGPFVLDDRLCERRQDACNERCTRAEIVARWGAGAVDVRGLWGDAAPRLPFREPAACVAERVQRFRAELSVRLRPGDVVLVVAHFEALCCAFGHRLGNCDYFVDETPFASRLHPLVRLPEPDTPAATRLADVVASQPARRAAVIAAMAQYPPTGVYDAETPDQWHAFLHTLADMYAEQNKVADEVAASGGVSDGATTETKETKETTDETTEGNSVTTTTITTAMTTTSSSTTNNRNNNTSTHNNLPGDIEDESKQMSRRTESQAFAQREQAHNAERLAPVLALLGCDARTPLALLSRAYHALPCGPLTSALRACRKRVAAVQCAIAQFGDPTSPLSTVFAAGMARKGVPDAEAAQRREAVLAAKHAALDALEAQERALLARLAAGADPAAAAYERVHTALASIVGIWDTATVATGRERAARGAAFEAPDRVELAAQLVLNSLAAKSSGSNTPPKAVRTVCNAPWVDAPGTPPAATTPGVTAGEVDVALVDAADESRVVALVEFKSHFFDVEAGFHQAGPARAHAVPPKTHIGVPGAVPPRTLAVPPATPCFVVTTVPPHPFYLGFPTAMRRWLDRVFDPALPPDAAAREADAVYAHLRSLYAGRQTPREWLAEHGEESCFII